MSEQQDKKTLVDDEIIDFNKSLRHDIVVDLTTDKEGKRSIPKDNETLNTIRGFLKDNDSSVYTSRRIDTEREDVENNKRAADLIEKVLGNAAHSKREGTADKSAKGPDVDPDKLGKFDITDGSVSEVGGQVDLDEIQREGRRVRKGMED